MRYRSRTRSVGRAAMALGHALDLADHYGQLANYMRLNGILPPTALPRPARGGKSKALRQRLRRAIHT